MCFPVYLRVLLEVSFGIVLPVSLGEILQVSFGVLLRASSWIYCLYHFKKLLGVIGGISAGITVGVIIGFIAGIIAVSEGNFQCYCVNHSGYFGWNHNEFHSRYCCGYHKE